MRKPSKHKSAKYSRKQTSRVDKFNVEVDVFCHGVQTPLHLNRIIGDGNCYWRAVAKQNNMKWYKLKSLTLESMMQHALTKQDDELCHNIKLLRKRNAWANMLAVLGTAAYLKREIRICVRGHIIRCTPQCMHTCSSWQTRRESRAINLHFENSHYSGVDAADVQHRLKASDFKLSSSLSEFVRLPLNAYPKDAIMIRHRMNHIGCNWATGSRNACRQLSHPSRCRTARVGQMPPQYRPAGQGLPKRRPNEDIAAQILRVAKAKSAAPEVVMPLMRAMPKNYRPDPRPHQGKPLKSRPILHRDMRFRSPRHHPSHQ